MSDIVERAEAALEDATPGPWEWIDEDFMGCGQVYTADEDLFGGNIAAPSGDCYPRSGYNPKGDMQFIAWARSGVPELVAEVKAARAMFKLAQSELQALNKAYGDLRAEKERIVMDCCRVGRVCGE